MFTEVVMKDMLESELFCIHFEILKSYVLYDV